LPVAGSSAPMGDREHREERLLGKYGSTKEKRISE
jgi:hypothetical protein